VEELSDTLDSLNSDIELIDDKIDSVMNQIEDTISSEAEEEIRNENDIIKSKEADADFPDYDIDKENDSKFKPKTEYGSYVRHVDSIKLENQAQKLARQFKVIAEKGDGWLHNQKRGKIDMHQINRLFNNNNKQPAIFRKKTQIEGVDLAVSILLDASGSMKNDRYIATDVTYVLSRGLELGKYKSEVIQFGTAGVYSSKYSYSADCRGVKSFNQKTQYAIKRFLPAAEGYTPLLKALEGAEKSLLKQSARRKVVFVVTDGQPYDPNISESEYVADCKKKVAIMQKKGYIVVGIGIHSYDNFKIFEHFIRCKTVNETEKSMIGVIKEILRKL
jgi:cobaltochelatase CobT